MAAFSTSVSSNLLVFSLYLLIFCVFSNAPTTTATPVAYKDHNLLAKLKRSEIFRPKNETPVSTCGNVSCKLNFQKEDVELFQQKIFDDEALAVFLFVTITNDSKVAGHLDSYSELNEQGKIVPYSLQLKEKWSWIRNRRAKFLATLPYDVDILSLTTLTKDVYNIIIKVNSTPSDCYPKLSQECLKEGIAINLMNFTQQTGQVCYKIQSVSDSQDHGYKCCHLDFQGRVHCDIPIKNNLWVEYALRLLWAISFAFGILSPLLLKYLPKEFQRGGKPKQRQMRRAESTASYDSFESSVMTVSKILISKSDGLLDIARSTTQSTACSRFSRILFVILLSLLPILQTLLYVFLKKSEVGVSDQLLGLGSAFLTLLTPQGKYALLAMYCFCILLVAIAMAIPKTLSELARKLSGKRDEHSFLGFRKPDELVCHSDKHGFQLMYEHMIFHLNCLMWLSFWKFAWSIVTYPLHSICCCCRKREVNTLDEADEDYLNEEPPGVCGQVVRCLFLLITYPVWLIIIISAFILYLLPVTYVAFRIWKFLFRFEVDCSCCEGIPLSIKMLSLPILYVLFIIFCICVEASYLTLVLVISVNIVFLGSVLGFTTMGVLFYFDAYISYVVLVILGLYYIIKAFRDLKVGFKRVKIIIFDECQTHDEELKAEASIRDTFSGQTNIERSGSTSSLQKLGKTIALVTFCDDKQVPSIPLKLFLAAQNDVFPFKRVVISKILNLFMIFIYLVLVFSFVMSLVEYKATDSFVQAIAVLLLGIIPCLMQGNPHEIPEKQQKWMKFHVREQIHKYIKRFA